MPRAPPRAEAPRPREGRAPGRRWTRSVRPSAARASSTTPAANIDRARCSIRSRQDVAGNIEAEDQRRPARVGGPQPVGGRSQRRAELGELERPDDPPSVVGMQPCRRAGITLRQDAVRALRSEPVVELLPLCPLLRARRRRQLELRQRCAKIEAGTAGHHGGAARRQRARRSPRARARRTPPPIPRERAARSRRASSGARAEP